jgi:hypothetical protein
MRHRRARADGRRQRPGCDGSGRGRNGYRDRQAQAAERGLSAEFHTGNALELADLDRSFNTVLDCGLFHVLEDSDRPTYVAGLQACTAPGAHYYMLCFSNLQPGDWGPRRIRQEEIRLTFVDGWLVESIEPSSIETTVPPGSARAWLASIVRI